MNDRLEAAFPLLAGSSYSVTSPATPEYNCIAWAAEDPSRPWWPDPMGVGYWPQEAPREETLAAFVSAFGLLGYEPCTKEDDEAGFGRVAVFVGASGRPTHMARQLDDGSWTSKLGDAEDIRHLKLEHLTSGIYGAPSAVLRRRSRPTPPEGDSARPGETIKPL